MPYNQNSSELVQNSSELVERLRFLSGVLRTEGAINASKDVSDAADALTAPAMLNGVEGMAPEAWIVDRVARQICNRWAELANNAEPEGHWQLHGDDIRLDARIAVEEIAQILDEARAADNRDAAGVCSCPRGHSTMFKLTDNACPQHGTPTAAPAGEAVALLLDALADITETVDKAKGAETYSATGHSDAARLAYAALDAWEKGAHPPAAEVREVDGSEVERVIGELRAYNPAADEYRGAHIHKVWAKELTAALSPPGRAEGEVPAFVSCRCHLPRDRELCLDKGRCIRITAQDTTP